MKKKLVIFGNGNHAKIVKQEIQKNSKLELKAVFDFINGKIKLNKKYNSIKINSRSKFYAISAVGNNKVRYELIKKISKLFKNVKWLSVISKDAIVNKNVKIGKGTLVVSGSVINTNSVIGNHCIINTKSTIDHDGKIGNFSDLAPGVNLAGNVRIGNFVFIGIGAAVKEKIKISSNIIIGAKSFVNKNCKSNMMYFGAPIKAIKKI